MESTKTILEIKTQFSEMTLVDHATFFTLNAKGNAVHSIVQKSELHTIQLKNLRYMMAILMFSEPPSNILLLGTGGGSLLHFFLHYYPESHLTTVDIDRELIEILQTNMALPADSPRLKHCFCDARAFLADNDEKFDLILVDIFSGAQSPGWLLETEMLKRLYLSLRDDQGALAMNLIVNSPSGFKHFYETLRRIFNRKTLCLGIEDYENTLVFATKGQSDLIDMNLARNRANNLSTQTGIPFQDILGQLAMTNPIGTGII